MRGFISNAFFSSFGGVRCVRVGIGCLTKMAEFQTVLVGERETR